MAERLTGAATLARLRHNFADLLARPLEEITPWLVEKWRAGERKRGKAPSTINRDLTALKAALSKAVDWEVITAHPPHKVKPIKIDKQGKVRYLSQNEEESLRAALVWRDDRVKQARERGNAWRQERGYPAMPSIAQHTYADYLTPMVLLSLNTGLRRGEVFNLTWDHVNFQTRILTVDGKGTKTGQTRHIPLNDEACSVLKAWRTQSTSEGFVFPGKKGLKKKAVTRAMMAVLPWGLFTNTQLQAVAEAFKKNEFVLTPVLAADLQWAAESFLRQSEYQKTLRLSEERKNYETLRDSLAELTKLFRNWNAPSRSQFVHRIADHHCQAAREIDEPCDDLFAELTKRFGNGNAPSSRSQFVHRIPGLSWQGAMKIDEPYRSLFAEQTERVGHWDNAGLPQAFSLALGLTMVPRSLSR
jgi:integrase